MRSYKESAFVPIPWTISHERKRFGECYPRRSEDERKRKIDGKIFLSIRGIWNTQGGIRRNVVLLLSSSSNSIMPIAVRFSYIGTVVDNSIRRY